VSAAADTGWVFSFLLYPGVTRGDLPPIFSKEIQG
jgi:hypothetical protein